MTDQIPVFPSYGCAGDNSVNALSHSVFSSGLFTATIMRDGLPIRFPAGDPYAPQREAGGAIDLFTYGEGDVLPPCAGFGGSTYMGTAALVHTNCFREGMLCEQGQFFAAVGLAARVGRPRVQGSDMPRWLWPYVRPIQELVAERTCVELHYGSMAARYRLGSLIEHPLLGSVYGPTVDLDGAPIDEMIPNDPNDPAWVKATRRVFASFPRAAIMDGDEKKSRGATVRLWHDGIEVGSLLGASATEPGTIEVPVKVWMFGMTVSARDVAAMFPDRTPEMEPSARDAAIERVKAALDVNAFLR